MTTLVGSIQIKRKTKAFLAALGVAPLTGQLTVESNTNGLKVGDGSTAYSSLPYINGILKEDTYTNIAALATATLLIPGARYKITDFATVHTIPNTAVTNTGTTEPLILTAATTSTFHVRAISTLYPQDVIEYELTDSSTANGTKGRITKRTDTLKNITFYYDWRNVKFRKYNISAGNPRYVYTTDVAGTGEYADIYTFDWSNASATYRNIEVGKLSSGDQLNNITFSNAGGFRSLINVRFGAECKNCGFACNITNFTAGIGNENFISTTVTTLGIISGQIEFGNYNGTNSGSVLWATGVVQFTVAGGSLKVGNYNAVGSGGILSFTGTTTSDIEIGNGLAQGVTISFGNGIRRIKIGTVSTITATAIPITTSSTVDKKIEPGYSNFSETNVSLTPASTTFDFTAARAYIGDITVTSTNATETLSTLSNMPTNHPVIFKAATGKTITFNVAGNIKVAGGVSFSIDGTKGDFIVLERRSDGNIYQIGGINY